MRVPFSSRLRAAAIAAMMTTAAAAAFAAPAVDYTERQVSMQSPVVNRVARVAGEVMHSDVLDVAGAAWLRLKFSRLELPSGAKLRITSLLDGAQQTLDARSMKQWENSSAYFNGSAVRLELLAAKGQRAGSYSVAFVRAGQPVPEPESQCGKVDDRVASAKVDRARLEPVGCTANLMASGCFITAGHCMSAQSLAKVVEFNVPPSNPDGSTNHPPPKDQYTLTSKRKSVDAGPGNDWGLFTVNPNSETGLTPKQAQQTKGLNFAKVVPAVGDVAEIVGYGYDSTPVARYTQQINSGEVVSVDSAGSLLRYRVDTEGGNSGSAVLVGGRVVAIHTHAGCVTSGDGGPGNQGTLVNNAKFKAAYIANCTKP